MHEVASVSVVHNSIRPQAAWCKTTHSWLRDGRDRSRARKRKMARRDGANSGVGLWLLLAVAQSDGRQKQTGHACDARSWATTNRPQLFPRVSFATLRLAGPRRACMHGPRGFSPGQPARRCMRCLWQCAYRVLDELYLMASNVLLFHDLNSRPIIKFPPSTAVLRDRPASKD